MKKELLNSFEGIEGITWIPEKDRDALRKSQSLNNDVYATHLLIQNCLSNYILEKIHTIEELLDKKAYHDIYVYFNTIDVVSIVANLYMYTHLDIPIDNHKELIEVINSKYTKIKELTNTILENVTNSKDYTFEKIVIFKLYCLHYLVNYDCQDKHKIPFDNTNELISYIEDIAGMTVEECKGCYKFVQFNRLPSEEIEAFKQKIKDTNMRIFKEPIHKFIAENF